ncbi:unnamed protein product [Orchesella dallaii]|uniref:RING-type domain-containing protein n=1 Tax=Orchesella dallaii TaxID=48710 RepID=A0ABP1R7Q1_9HEXA
MAGAKRKLEELEAPSVNPEPESEDQRRLRFEPNVTVCAICYEQVNHEALNWDEAPAGSPAAAEAGTSSGIRNVLAQPPPTSEARRILEVLGCGHVYHEVCADKYFEKPKSGGRPTLACPMSCPPSARRKLHLDFGDANCSRSDSDEVAYWKQKCRDITFQKRDKDTQLSELSGKNDALQAELQRLLRKKGEPITRHTAMLANLFQKKRTERLQPQNPDAADVITIE